MVTPKTLGRNGLNHSSKLKDWLSAEVYLSHYPVALPSCTPRTKNTGQVASICSLKLLRRCVWLGGGVLESNTQDRGTGVYQPCNLTANRFTLGGATSNLILLTTISGVSLPNADEKKGAALRMTVKWLKISITSNFWWWSTNPGRSKSFGS